MRVRDGVDFRRETSTTSTDIVTFDPPFPPDASWCARTTEPSMMEPVSSTSTCSSLKILAQCPLRAQLENLLYTDFQGPKRSGRSRQGIPVLPLNRTASINNRSPRTALGPVRFVGRHGSICRHCSSVKECRRTWIFDHNADRSTSFHFPERASDRNDPAFSFSN